MNGRVFKLVGVAVLIMFLLATGLTNPPTVQATNTTFSDDFNGTSLDTTRWTIIEGDGQIGVAGGLLLLQDGEHKFVNSIQTFAPTALDPVTATARISLGGDYNVFGINPDDLIGQGQATSYGMYFDTL